MTPILDMVRSTLPLSGLNDPTVPLYQALTGMLDGVASDGSVSVTGNSALRQSTFFAGASLIAETMGSLSVKLLERDDTSRTPVRPDWARPFWYAPNPDDELPEFRESGFLSMIVDGNAIHSVFPDRAGRIGAMYVLDPSKVVIRRMPAPDNRKVYIIDGEPFFDFDGTTPGIWHVPALRKPGALRGMSRVAQMRDLLGIAIAADKWIGDFYQSGTTAEGYLSVKESLDDTEAERLIRRFNRRATGARNRRRTIVLDNAAEYKRFQLSPADASFLETWAKTDEKVAMILRIAPHLLGMVDKSTSWGSGIEEQTLSTIVYTYRTWAVRYERRAERLLRLYGDVEYRHNFESLLRGKVQERYQAYGLGRQWGFLSANDILRLEDMPPLGPEGDIYLQPSNMVPAGTPPQVQQGAGGRSPEEIADLLVRVERLLAADREDLEADDGD